MVPKNIGNGMVPFMRRTEIYGTSSFVFDTEAVRDHGKHFLIDTEKHSHDFMKMHNNSAIEPTHYPIRTGDTPEGVTLDTYWFGKFTGLIRYGTRYGTRKSGAVRYGTIYGTIFSRYLKPSREQCSKSTWLGKSAIISVREISANTAVLYREEPDN